MGLDTTHGCFHGGYITFNLWRERVANAAGWYLDYSDPESELAPGRWFFWADYPNDADLWPDEHPLLFLLGHEDCEGDIPPEMCGPLAEFLEEIAPLVADASGDWPPGMWRDMTRQFAAGLRDAEHRKERVVFR